MNGVKTVNGKVLLTFSLREFPTGIPDTDGRPMVVAPPHWRMVDPEGGVTCWGHCGNGSYESMIAIMRLAAIGAKHASHDELVEAGIIVPRAIWTPDKGDDDVEAIVSEHKNESILGLPSQYGDKKHREN